MKLDEFIFDKKIILETRTPNQILMELNVINIQDIDLYLKNQTKDLYDDYKKWFMTRGKKYLINSEDQNTVINQFSANAEPWMLKAQKRGEVLYRFTPNGELTAKFHHLVDYINDLHNKVIGRTRTDQQTKSQAKKTLQGLGNMSMQQAIQASDDWLTKLSQAKIKGEVSVKDEEGLIHIMDYGNLTWVQLTTAACLDREGKLMRHCVGGYSYDVESGNTQIYSLRDTTNQPHATIEVRYGKELAQVKGINNKRPDSKYRSAIIELLNKLNVPPTDTGLVDVERMGIVRNPNNNTYGDVIDIAETTYDNNGIQVKDWGDGRIIVYKNKIMAKYGLEGEDSWSRNVRLSIDEINIHNFKSADVGVPNKKINDPIQKLAHFIMALSPLKNKYDKPLFIELTPGMLDRIDKPLKNYFISSRELQSFQKNKLKRYHDEGESKVGLASEIGEEIFSKESIEDNETVQYQVLKNVKTDRSSDTTNSSYDLITNTFIRNGELVAALSFYEKKEGVDYPGFNVNNNVVDFNGHKKATINGVSENYGHIYNTIGSYINNLKQKDRPIIQQGRSGADTIHQHPETLEIATQENFDKSFVLSQVGNLKLIKEIYGISSDVYLPQYVKTEKPILLYSLAMVKDGETTKDSKAYMTTLIIDEDYNTYYYGVSNWNKEEQSDAIKILNNSAECRKVFKKPVKGAADYIRELESRHKVYFNPSNRKFSDELVVSGDQITSGDVRGINIRKKIYIYKGDNMICYWDKSGTSFDRFYLDDKLAVVNNAPDIAEILNQFNFAKDSSSYTRDMWSQMVQVGIGYSEKYEKFIGQKSSGKKIGSGDGYEIQQFKNTIFIKNDEGRLIGQLNGEKFGPTVYYSSVKLPYSSDDKNVTSMGEEDLDNLFGALKDIKKKIKEDAEMDASKGKEPTSKFLLGWKPKSKDSSEIRSVSSFENQNPFFQFYLKYEGQKRGFDVNVDSITKDPSGLAGNNSHKYETEIISKGKGGTWVKELISKADLNMKAFASGLNPTTGESLPDDEDIERDNYGDPVDDRYKRIERDQRVIRDINPEHYQGAYTLYMNKEPILRVYKSPEEQRYPTRFFELDGYYAREIDSSDLFQKYKKELSRLAKFENLVTTIPMKRMHIYFNDKKDIVDFRDNPKLNSLLNGVITYEDGTTWRRHEKTGGRYDNYKKAYIFTLYRPETLLDAENISHTNRPIQDNNGANSFPIMQVEVFVEKEDGDTGLEDIKFLNKDVRRNTKIYRPFLNDLLDILDEYHSIEI